MTMKLILLTGAAGGAARMIRPLLRETYRLRLSDRAPVADRHPDEEDVPADLTDAEAVARAVEGVDGIVHFGGFSVEGPWEAILPANIEGTYNLYEAARQAGVRRIVFASSNHAVGFYRRDQTIGDNVTPLPDSRYGVSKVFGEALGSLYGHKYGMEILSIRIGNVLDRPVDARRLAIWISPRDLVQLIGIGLERPGIRHEIVYGVSGNTRSWWDNSNAHRLGYRPQDDSEVFAEAVLAADPGPSGDDVIDLHQGGPFCRLEAGGGAGDPPP
ncbi:uronate dehydrogenase [Tepidamorphus gemmatus]|uniref:Uronate dehydrogenase n=2 Tax=Tepidamorphus gemmatus TaxID=747076 RepID=A0A4R3MI49_9HYPH|nr:NAD(P)-dependent oxidoreductase [Tepidamorphus gemmatus]TCT12049.1 uronate dehydrogenase [Tepidamorphus gemmatus]